MTGNTINEVNTNEALKYLDVCTSLTARVISALAALWCAYFTTHQSSPIKQASTESTVVPVVPSTECTKDAVPSSIVKRVSHFINAN